MEMLVWLLSDTWRNDNRAALTGNDQVCFASVCVICRSLAHLLHWPVIRFADHKDESNGDTLPWPSGSQRRFSSLPLPPLCLTNFLTWLMSVNVRPHHRCHKAAEAWLQ